MAIVYTDQSGGKKSAFGKRISKIIQNLRETGEYANIRELTVCRELSAFMSNELNGNVKVFIDPDTRRNAHAKVPMLTNNNPFMLRRWIGDHVLGMDYEAKDVARTNYQKRAMLGGFDFRANKFFGWMSEIAQEYTLSYDVFHPANSDDVSPDEVTAFLLHENGHVIQMFYGIGFTANANYVLNLTHSELLGVTDHVKRAQILTEIAGTEKFDIMDDVNYVAKVNNERLTATIILDAMRTRFRQELGEASGAYGKTGAESLADYYASQHGFGVEAVTGLAKIGISPDSRRAMESARYFGSIQGVALITAGLFGGALPTAIMFLLFISSGYDPETIPYDNCRDRAQRICNTMINNLRKSRGNDNKERIKEIEKLQLYIASLPQDNRDYVQLLHELMTPTGRKRKAARDVEKALEELASHKLYLKAERFSTL